MKRVNNIYSQIISIENLQLADAIAQMGKAKQYGVQRHNRNAEANIAKLHGMLVDKTFKTSPYTTFTVYEPKERLIFRLPYYPDRIVHHAIMNVIEPVLVGMFTADTYACIKGRGVHKAAKKIKKVLVKHEASTRYCLKIDVRKFYPSIDHHILLQQLRRKFKDNDFLQLMEGIITSSDGLPIGNYLSQSLSNFYLTGFDHWLKQDKKVQHYFRYVDDIIILAGSKEYLHGLRVEIESYLKAALKLDIKSNWQVFPVDVRGIDMLGYRFFRKYSLLRKTIKQKFARAVKSNKGQASIAAYKGWASHCNSRHLLKKLLTKDERF